MKDLVESFFLTTHLHYPATPLFVACRKKSIPKPQARNRVKFSAKTKRPKLKHRLIIERINYVWPSYATELAFSWNATLSKFSRDGPQQHPQRSVLLSFNWSPVSCLSHILLFQQRSAVNPMKCDRSYNVGSTELKRCLS